MSELKAINAYRLTTNTEDSDVYIHNDEFECGGDLVECYLKSDADAVIAELEESHKKEVGQLLIEIAELKETLKNSRNARKYWRKEYLFEYKECCHQKYKRCLTMARWCEATALWCYQEANTLPTGFHATLFGKPVMIETHRLYNRFEILTKWSNRWLELAEKFKDKETK